MKKKLGVFLIRGAGKADSIEQEQFVEKLNHRLIKIGVQTSEIHYEYANWYCPTQKNEEMLLKKFLDAGYSRKGKALGRFILYLVGDLVAYTGVPNNVNNTYEETHRQIHQSILNLNKALKDGSPLLIIASSLGAQIISDYIWDRQRLFENDSLGGSEFERFETLTAIFMLGTIQPLYFTSNNIEEAKPFSFPPDKLADKYKSIASWTNYIDRNDPLGFPLKPINAQFNKVVTADVEVNAGNWLFSWSAASHLGYWKTRKIRNSIADYIMNLLKI